MPGFQKTWLGKQVKVPTFLLMAKFNKKQLCVISRTSPLSTLRNKNNAHSFLKTLMFGAGEDKHVQSHLVHSAIATFPQDGELFKLIQVS